MESSFEGEFLPPPPLPFFLIISLVWVLWVICGWLSSLLDVCWVLLLWSVYWTFCSSWCLSNHCFVWDFWVVLEKYDVWLVGFFFPCILCLWVKISYWFVASFLILFLFLLSFYCVFVFFFPLFLKPVFKVFFFYFLVVFVSELGDVILGYFCGDVHLIFLSNLIQIELNSRWCCCFFNLFNDIWLLLYWSLFFFFV